MFYHFLRVFPRVWSLSSSTKYCKKPFPLSAPIMSAIVGLFRGRLIAHYFQALFHPSLQDLDRFLLAGSSYVSCEPRDGKSGWIEATSKILAPIHAYVEPSRRRMHTLETIQPWKRLVKRLQYLERGSNLEHAKPPHIGLRGHTECWLPGALDRMICVSDLSLCWPLIFVGRNDKVGFATTFYFGTFTHLLLVGLKPSLWWSYLGRIIFMQGKAPLST